MVLTGGGAHGAFRFARMGCTGSCCEPDGRQSVTIRRTPFTPAQKFAFILSVNQTLGSRHNLPPEVLRRIFELSATTERIIEKRASYASHTSRLRDQTPDSELRLLTLNAPV